MNKFIMLVGLPGSGKSSVAQKLSITENAVIHSSDTLREELFGDVNECNRNDELFNELHHRIKSDLQEGKNIIYDATNINYKKRKAFLDGLKKFDVHKQCVLVATPYEKCLSQNTSRERQVPEYVTKRMYMNIYIPQYYEGWDSIEIRYNAEGYEFNTHELFNGENGLNRISQDNPHHTLTIGKHCLRCMQISEELLDDFETNLSALYHDIGKRFTKVFKNSKGEVTEQAHYYQHHLVSAYDSLFYLSDLDQEQLLKIANYIQWHMYPFFIQTEKTRNKFIGLVGQEFYDKLMILHEADKRAK